MNTYRKGIVVGIALLTLVVGPLSVSAVSIADLQAQVQTLLGQIAGLQGSVTVAQPQTASTNQQTYRVCSVSMRNLARGSQGDDVRALQEFLQGNGYFSATATGYFGPMTASAVAHWQSSQGVSAAGAFGPMSRERMRVWCGNQVDVPSMPFSATPSQGAAPLTTSFSTMLSGFRMRSIYYTIDFGDGASERAADCYAPADGCLSPGQNTHTYTQSGSYTATLNKITDVCQGTPGCMAPIQTEVVAKTQVTVGGIVSCKPLTYMPIACSDGTAAQPQHNESGCLIGYECPVANYTPPASCKSWNDGCNQCGRTSPGGVAACTQRACFAAGKGYCSVYFDNASTGANRPPVVSGFSGPTALSVNQTGTWSVQVSDPENGTLSYQITWGDENTYGATSNMSLTMQAANQNSSFTHSYASPGTYVITIAVRDSAGQQATATATVQVGTGNTACTLQYDPVCGRPAGCSNTCAPGMYCTMMCQLYPAQTYGNRCSLDAAGAQFLYSGACVPGGAQY